MKKRFAMPYLELIPGGFPPDFNSEFEQEQN
jgi:hypothetical protein